MNATTPTPETTPETTDVIACARAVVAGLSIADLIDAVERFGAEAQADEGARVMFAVAAAEAARRLGVSATVAARSHLGTVEYLRFVAAFDNH
ncbi:hypothetical protein [Luteimicrobium sp. DT211]|uniref:hypothetical protein n=1 Tax=Luteimicrobium sp. DT211 TaxID=3393412 RepID=UPI003CEE223A